jgi:hypothetical protein
MAASSHPSRHEREVERGATSRPRAGRPRHVGGRSGATTVIVESQPQHTTGAVPAPSVVAGADATLLVARQLLNNPPPSGASPSAAEEWRHNVDQLVVSAINTSLHERRCQLSAQHSHTTAAHAPFAAHVPHVERAPPVGPDAYQTARHRAPMAGYATAGLRADDERRWQSAIKNARYRQALKRYHQRFVRSRELQVDDLVLQRILNREGMNKLFPSWEGPFRVTRVCHPGCVRLAMEDGESVPRPWNIEHLRKFYA